MGNKTRFGHRNMKNNSISAFLRENGMVAVFLAQVLQNGVQYETF